MRLPFLECIIIKPETFSDLCILILESWPHFCLNDARMCFYSTCGYLLCVERGQRHDSGWVSSSKAEEHHQRIHRSTVIWLGAYNGVMVEVLGKRIWEVKVILHLCFVWFINAPLRSFVVRQYRAGWLHIRFLNVGCPGGNRMQRWSLLWGRDRHWPGRFLWESKPHITQPLNSIISMHKSWPTQLCLNGKFSHKWIS